MPKTENALDTNEIHMVPSITCNHQFQHQISTATHKCQTFVTKTLLETMFFAHVTYLVESGAIREYLNRFCVFPKT